MIWYNIILYYITGILHYIILYVRFKKGLSALSVQSQPYWLILLGSSIRQDCDWSTHPASAFWLGNLRSGWPLLLATPTSALGADWLNWRIVRVRQSVELETEVTRKYFSKWKYNKWELEFVEPRGGSRWAEAAGERPAGERELVCLPTAPRAWLDG